MPGRYKPYQEYKDSGVDWLGKLPKHWEIKRVGQCFKERRQKVSDKDYPPLSVTMQGIVTQLETAAKSDDGDNRKLVLKNDFVINSRSDRKGSSGTSPLDGSVSLISIVLEPREILPAFVHHLFRSYPFQEEFYRYGKGIVADLWSTNFSEMKNILIPGIPAQEQIQIANFLDHETGKIDALIEKQQQLIKLLQEKRQAVISHSVTKGLNPAAPMKDSGIAWLGQVPAHWFVRRFKFLCDDIIAGPFGSSLTKDVYVEQGYKVYGQEHVIPGDFSIGDYFISEKYFRELSRYEVQPGDILISCVGTFGKIAVFPIGAKKGIINPRLIKATIKKGIEPFYLRELLKSELVYKQFEWLSRGGTMGVINIGILNEILSIVPPKEEQNQIVSYVNQIKAKFNTLIDLENQAISLLKERRTALISAAVTGKIDVRDWRAPAGSTVYSAQRAQNTGCETEMEMFENGEEVADD
ncbi:MAG: Type I restriction-modification system, specificity subunit S [Candidatus Rifleibacterium amylolyticum]|nr:MAG: Type I restriction-modification system, specificity subunit S [Candidatus Rifleibacterium amylolyticum]